MNNFDHAIEATATGLNSAGSAARENEAYMSSIQASLSQLSSSFQELANNVIGSDLANVILKIANAFLELLNTPIGTFVTQVGLLSGLFWGGTGLIKAMDGVVPGILSFVKGLGQASTVATTAAESVGGLSKVLNLSLGQWAGIATAIVGVISVISTIIDSIETLDEQIEKSNQKLEEYGSQLESNRARLEEINNLPWTQRTEDIREEEAALRAENDQLERNIELQKEAAYSATKERFEGKGSVLTTGYGINEYVLANSDLDEITQEAIKNFVADGRFYASAEEAAVEIANYLGVSFKTISDQNGQAIKTIGEQALEYFASFGVDTTKLFEQAIFEEEVSFEERITRMEDDANKLKTAIESDMQSTGELSDATLELADNFNEAYGTMYDDASLIADVQEANGDIIDENAQRVIAAFENVNEEQSKVAQNYDQVYDSVQQTYQGIQGIYEEIRQINSETENLNIVEIFENAHSIISDASSDLEEFGSIGNEAFSNLLSLVPDLTSSILTQKLGIEGLDGALFNANGTLTDSGVIALDSAGSFESLGKAILQAQIAINNAKISTLNTQIDTYGDRAMELTSAFLDIADQYEKGSQQYLEAQDAALSANKDQAELIYQRDALNKLLEEEKILLENWPSLFDTTTSAGGASSVRDQAEETKDILTDLKAWLEDKDHQIFLLENQQQAAEDQELFDEAERFANERAQIIQNNMAVLHNWANALRNQGYAEDSDYIKELQELWWQYKNELDNIYDDIDARREESQKAELERIDELREKQLQAREDALSKEKEAYEALANYMVDRIDEEMAAIDAEIDALDKQNDKLEDQIALEEKLDALARAKSQRVMVYKDGRFQYVSDIDAVSEAQADLDEYNREQALQAQKDALEAEKDILQQYKDEWSSLTQKYQEEQDKLLLEEYFGINAENDNWKKRLDNFQDFYDEYAKICDNLAALQEQLQKDLEELYNNFNTISNILNKGPSSIGSGIASGITSGILASGGNPIWGAIGGAIGGALGAADAISGGSSGKGSSSSSSSLSGTITSDKGYTIGSGKGQSFVLDAPAGSTMTGGDGSKWTKNPDGSTTIVDKDGVKHTVSSNKRASGVLSNPTDSIDLVGEEGPEMRFNPKGAGIVPANMTKNLWAWGTTNPSQYLNTISGVGANSGQSIAITIQNFNPSLPNVSNGEDFVNYLNTSFVRHVVQFTTKR